MSATPGGTTIPLPTGGTTTTTTSGTAQPGITPAAPVDHRTPMSQQSVSAVKKLTGVSNYKEWADSVEDALGLCDYWQIVSGEEKAPTDKTSSEYLLWARNDKRVFSFIRSTLHVNLRHSFESVKTAKDLWDALKSRYSSKGDFEDYLAFKSLVTTSIPENADIRTAFDEFSVKRERLTRAGNMEMSEKLLAFAFIASLPPSYSNILSTIFAGCNFNSTTFEAEDIIPSLISKQTLESNSKGNAVKQKKKAATPKDKSSKPPSPCPICKGDHWKAECPEKDKGKGKGKDSGTGTNGQTATTSAVITAESVESESPVVLYSASDRKR